MTYVTDTRTIGEGQNNSSHISAWIPRYETISCTSYVTCISQWQRNWQEWLQLWQTVENKGSFRYSQCCIFEILQPFWTFGDWQGDCTFPREGHIQAVYFKQTRFKSKFTSSVTLMATHDMVVYLGKDRKWATKDITAFHATVKQLTLRVKGHGHKL